MKNLLHFIKNYKLATLEVVLAMIFTASYFFLGDEDGLIKAVLLLVLSSISVLTVRVKAIEAKVK